MDKNNISSRFIGLSGLWRSKTGTGILVALAVIAFFILAATFLKSLVFGMILACFFLPLEKFFEKHFFQWPAVRFVCRCFELLAVPFQLLKDYLAGKRPLSPEAAAEQKRQYLILRSCIMAALSFLAAVILAFFLVGYLIIPAAVSAGRKIKESPAVRKTMSSLETMAIPDDEAVGKTPEEPRDADSFKGFVRNLRRTVPDYLKKNHKDLADLAFKGGKGIAAGTIALLTFLGGFAFDLLLTAFFFFFFLQHLASFMSGERENESIGNWCVRSIFNSRWMPEVSESTRQGAVEIIDWITAMFVKWIRGYLWIIIIETVLYLTAFSLCSVPYAPLLAMVAGLTILLPFLGPIGSFLLTVTICLVFCREHTAGTIIGVSITYLIINGILEQLFLYPKLIGGAIELSTVETIIAVLLGGLAAGIPGMIFAVPAAAILKYLVPKIYQSMREVRPEPGVKGSTE